jgi:hypothetical protein
MPAPAHCLTRGCPNPPQGPRGVCLSCGFKLRKELQSGWTTWELLEAAGRVRRLEKVKPCCGRVGG